MDPLSCYWRSESAQFDLIMNVCGYSIIVLLHRPCRKHRGSVALTAHQRAKKQVCTAPEAPNGHDLRSRHFVKEIQMHM